MFHLAE